MKGRRPNYQDALKYWEIEGDIYSAKQWGWAEKVAAAEQKAREFRRTHALNDYWLSYFENNWFHNLERQGAKRRQRQTGTRV